MNLAELFKESIDISKENDRVISDLIISLGKLLTKEMQHDKYITADSQSLEQKLKSKVKKIHKKLDKAWKLKSRLEKAQSKLSKEMLKNHVKVARESDESR